MKKSIMYLFLLTFIIAGCASTGMQPPVVTQLSEHNSFSMIIPKNLDNVQPSIHGVYFKDDLFQSSSNYGISKVSGYIMKVSDNLLSVSKINGFKMIKDGSMEYSEARYNFAAESQDMGSHWLVNITPSQKIERVHKGIVGSHKLPDFSYESALSKIRNYYFNISFEENSEFNIASIEGNFKRLMSGGKLHTYRKKLDNCYIDATVFLSDYRDGTKVSGEARVECKAQHNNINVMDDKKNVEDFLKSVINN